ncbi:MAG: sulfatase, partial [bacterium]|nr:sulfatase [bacterium]
TLLTGLYAHNHGVKGNSPPEGGFPAFQDFSTLATWLKNSGYQTSMVGKYLNAYGFVTNSQTYIPPGWDDWHAIVKGSSQYGFYYDYQLNENGTVNQYGIAPADYSTTVFANKAEAFINATSTAQPFFILVAPHGPHSPFLPEPLDIGSLAGIPPARPPSFNEADVSDKPQWVKNLVLFTPTEIAQIDLDRQAYLEMLSSEDRAIQQIYNALQNKGVLNNTIFIFTSDNGYSWGEHRWFENKNCVYEECIRVPLWVRVPGQTPKVINNLISSIDLAPTISEMAGIIPPNLVNGKSFVPLMENISTPWRSEILLESFGHGSKYPTLTNLRSFSAIREDQYKYVEYINGDKEFYDLAVDSYELNNSINNPAYSSIINNLKAKLTNLKAQ